MLNSIFLFLIFKIRILSLLLCIVYKACPSVFREAITTNFVSHTLSIRDKCTFKLIRIDIRTDGQTDLLINGQTDKISAKQPRFQNEYKDWFILIKMFLSDNYPGRFSPSKFSLVCQMFCYSHKTKSLQLFQNREWWKNRIKCVVKLYKTQNEL